MNLCYHIIADFMVSWHQSWHQCHDKYHNCYHDVDFLINAMMTYHHKNVTTSDKIWYYHISNILSWFYDVVPSMLNQVPRLIIKILLSWHQCYNICHGFMFSWHQYHDKYHNCYYDIVFLIDAMILSNHKKCHDKV